MTGPWGSRCDIVQRIRVIYLACFDNWGHFHIERLTGQAVVDLERLTIAYMELGGMRPVAPFDARIFMFEILGVMHNIGVRN